MGRRGQALLVFCLIMCVILAVLHGSIMAMTEGLNKSVTRLRTRILSYQATIQIAQIVQRAYQGREEFSGCTDPSLGSVQEYTVGGIGFCMPTGSVCVNSQFRYCIAQSGGALVISEYRTDLEEEVYAAAEPLRFDFSLLPKAYAQAVPKPWLPSLTGATTTTMNMTGFDTRLHIHCQGAATPNANCLRLRICTNGSDSCPNIDDYFDTTIAVVFRKN